MRLRAALLAALLARTAAAGFADHFAVDDDVGIAKIPRFGHTRVLVIPVEVGDANDWTDARAYFDSGPCDDELGPYTFRCYWQRVSAGNFDPEPVFVDPLFYEACPAPSGDCTFSLFGDAVTPFLNSYQTLERFLDDLIARDGLDLADFDAAGPEGDVPDGVADGILVLFDSDDFLVLAECNSMAHSTELQGVGAPFARHGVQVNLWAWAGVVGPTGPPCGEFAEIATHEFGHLIGFADQYVSPPFTAWGLGLTLMGAPDGQSTCYTCSLDAHSRVLAGWADVVELGAGTTEIEPALETGKVYRTGGTEEFWLIENRQEIALTGGFWDQGLSGLTVYHCDETLPFPVTAMADYQPWHALTTNLWARARGSYPWDYLFVPGDSLEPAPIHDPPSEFDEFRTDSNCFDGTPSGLSVTDIASVGSTGGRTLASLEAVIRPALPCGTDPDGGSPQRDGGAAPGDDAGADQTAADRGGCSCNAARRAPRGGWLSWLLAVAVLALGKGRRGLRAARR